MSYVKVTPQEFQHAIGEYVRLNLAPYERTGTVVAANARDTAASIEIKVNDLSPLTGSEIADEWRDEQGAFQRNALQSSESIHGHPVFETSEQKWILILCNQAPVVAAVSRERYLAVKMRKNRAAIPAAV
jgi:hypothetical protein